MKFKRNLLLLGLAVLCLHLTGCELIGGIFKAGIWAGALVALAVLALVAFGLSKFRNR